MSSLTKDELSSEELVLRVPNRFSSLCPEKQLTLVRLVNHMVAHGGTYSDFCFMRLFDMTQENPGVDDIPGFDKEAFLAEHPILDEEEE